jgi:hypothetical protein
LLRCEAAIEVSCIEVCRTSIFSAKGTDCHFLHRAKSNQKARGVKPCDPRFKALSEVILQKFPAARIETGFARKTPVKRL